MTCNSRARGSTSYREMGRESIRKRMFMDRQSGEWMVMVTCSGCERLYAETLSAVRICTEEDEGSECVSCDEKAEESSRVVTVIVSIRAKSGEDENGYPLE